jgi:kinesin family protein 18/19
VSSRSHAILQVFIEIKDKVTGLDNQVTLGKFILVDLAGSERLSNMKSNNQRVTESGSINKSLLALANCINTLVENAGKQKFIPWRDSKLTRILKVNLF